MAITLREQDRLNSLNEEYVKPSTLEELISQKSIKDSLEDKGISKFKEITDIQKISFGHFIVMEKILGAESLDFESKIKMIAPFMLRPLNEVKLDNGNEEKESKHVESVLDENIGNVYGAFKRFMDLRSTYLYKTYNGVIYASIDDDSDDDSDKEEEGTNINSGTSARDFHSKKFFWQSMISKVTNGDIFKISRAVELMMYEVMPFLAEKRSLEIVEYLEYKASKV